MIKWFLCVGMLIVPNVAFSSKDNAWGKPGEAIRYHIISSETGDSSDLGFWPIDNELTKHVIIQNNNKSYLQFNRTRLIKNIRNKSLEDFFMSYYVVLYHCKKHDEFLSWNDCADRGHDASVIRRSTVGGFAVSWEDKHGVLKLKH
ncbi:MAG: hypothetical protein K0U54_06185 [Bacteroidetes bacterium]|nr:hypothetical protein [Bacteroidota bacterium]